MSSPAQLRRLNTAGLPDDYPMPGKRYGLGVSWDSMPGQPKVDIDLQCVVVDTAGAIIDCAYYNNLKAVRSITHSGDETTGERSGIDEQVWVLLPKVPEKVALLVFVLAAYKGGTLRSVNNGRLHVFEESERNVIAEMAMESSDGCVDVVAAVFRGPTGWTLRIIEEPAQQGQHFMDIIDLLAKVIRTFIPSAPARQKVAFAMEKGGVCDLPQTMDAITIGLGWDTGAGQVDLDVSAVLLDSSGGDLETVFFGRLESPEHGIKHSGDNLTGEGEGDDEQIMVNLTRVGERVAQIAFVINIYTRGKSFREVSSPYCRVVDNTSGSELCRYSLSDAGSESALIVAKIAREAGGRWGFHALGLPCVGRTWKDSLPHIQRACTQATRQLMARGGTTDMSHSAPTAPHYAPTLPGTAEHPQAFAQPPVVSDVPCSSQKNCTVM